MSCAALFSVHAKHKQVPIVGDLKRRTSSPAHTQQIACAVKEAHMSYQIKTSQLSSPSTQGLQEK